MTQSTTTDYLDPKMLATISSIDLRARMIVEGAMAGMHRSPYQGFSVEFAQHRQYAPGDDTRFLDWKVFGRTDKLYLKQYQQETNLDLVVMVDVSGSMGYASGGSAGQHRWRKYDHAASLAAALAYIALRQQDRVGLAFFADEIRMATRLSNARDHWRLLIELLGGEPVGEDHAELLRGAEIQTGRTTDLARLFDQMTARLVRRSLLVLVSDLFDSTEALERGMALLRHRGHDLLVLQCLDQAELTFPFRAPSEFIGLESEGRIGMDPVALKNAYLEVLHEHLGQVEQITRRFGFDYLLIDTSEPMGPALGHFLARRGAMVSKGKLRRN